MRVPIQLALTFPKRLPSDFPRIDWATLKELTFENPDLSKFQCLALAYHALKSGGTAPAVLNAANEIAVAQFLAKEISFEQIPVRIEQALHEHEFVDNPTVDQLLSVDQWARKLIKAMPN
jgi:1-deoxy-D-xylulose-5-phosphate reductoisomerase